MYIAFGCTAHRQLNWQQIYTNWKGCNVARSTITPTWWVHPSISKSYNVVFRAKSVDDLAPLFIPEFFDHVHTVLTLDSEEGVACHNTHVHKFEQKSYHGLVVLRKKNIHGQHEISCLHAELKCGLRVPLPKRGEISLNKGGHVLVDRVSIHSTSNGPRIPTTPTKIPNYPLLWRCSPWVNADIRGRYTTLHA